VAGDEVEGLAMALADTRRGDVIALMAQEQVEELAAELSKRGRPVG
jgi:hypothetical protein